MVRFVDLIATSLFIGHVGGVSIELIFLPSAVAESCCLKWMPRGLNSSLPELPSVCWGLQSNRNRAFQGSLLGCACSFLDVPGLLFCSTSYCCLSPLYLLPFVQLLCLSSCLSPPRPKMYCVHTICVVLMD